MQQKFIKVKIDTQDVKEGAFAVDSIWLIMPAENKKQSIIKFHNGMLETIDEPFHDLVSRLNGFNVN